MVIDYENLLPREFNQILEATPVAYLPWGALEWHGEHMALGNDGLKAQAILRRVAQAAGGIVLPPVWCGYWTMQWQIHGGFPLTLEFRRETVQQLLAEYIQQLSAIGFKLIVVLSGHYGSEHMKALRETAEQETKQANYRGPEVWILADHDLVHDLGYTGDHAAKWEMSILMHLYPELVDMSRLNDENAGRSGGILGEDPRSTASEQSGSEIVTAIVDRLVRRVKQALMEP